MAIRFMDSCSHYESADLPRKYDIVSSAQIQTTNGRRGGGCLRLFTGSVSVEKNVPANATYVVGFAGYASGDFNGTSDIILFKEGATIHMSLEIRNNMRMFAMRGGSTQIGESDKTEIPLARWNYYEVKCFVHDSTGTFQVWKNGTLVPGLNLSSQDTANGGTPTIDSIEIQGGPNLDWRVCDIVMLDDTGAAPYNDRIGDVIVDALLPDGDGATNDFTPQGAGANYVEVDESPAIDDDSTYVESSVVNEVDLWTLEALPTSPGAATVFGVQAVLTARKDDSGTRDIATILRPVSTNRIGATQALSTSYAMYLQMEQISPETAVAWTEAEVDGTELGVEVAT